MVVGQASPEYQEHMRCVDRRQPVRYWMQINREACRQLDKYSCQTCKQIVRNAGILPGRTGWPLHHTAAHWNADECCEGRGGQCPTTQRQTCWGRLKHAMSGLMSDEMRYLDNAIGQIIISRHALLVLIWMSCREAKSDWSVGLTGGEPYGNAKSADFQAERKTGGRFGQADSRWV